MHLSDLHFGTEVQGAVAALRRVVSTLAPDLVIVSGDLTQRARPRQFRNARDFLDSLDVCSVVVPGNHDIPLFNWFSRLADPFSRYERHFGAGLTFSVMHRAIAVLGVSSVRPERHQSGAVGRRFRQWIRCEFERLDRSRTGEPGRLNIVVCHHPLISPGYEETAVRASRGGRLATEWSELGVDLVLSGHIHRPFLLEGPHHPSANGRRLWHLGAGTALSHRLRADIPNSFNVIRSSVIDDRLSFEVSQFDLPHGQTDFSCVSRQTVNVAAGLVHSPERDDAIAPGHGRSAHIKAFSDPGDRLWRLLEANWDALQGRVKERWGFLTDDHLLQIAGRRDQLVASLQRLYGISREQADSEVETWGLRNHLTNTAAHHARAGRTT